MRNSSLVAALFGISFVAVGCAAAPPTQRRASEHPVAATEASVRRFALAEVRFDGMSIDGEPEAEWIARQPDSLREELSRARATFTRNLVEAMAVEGGVFELASAPSSYPRTLVEIQVESFEAGVFHFTVSATSPDGAFSLAPVKVMTHKPAATLDGRSTTAFVLPAACTVATLLENGAPPVSVASLTRTSGAR